MGPAIAAVAPTLEELVAATPKGVLSGILADSPTPQVLRQKLLKHHGIGLPVPAAPRKPAVKKKPAPTSRAAPPSPRSRSNGGGGGGSSSPALPRLPRSSGQATGIVAKLITAAGLAVIVGEFASQFTGQYFRFNWGQVPQAALDARAKSYQPLVSTGLLGQPGMPAPSSVTGDRPAVAPLVHDPSAKGVI